MHTTFLSSTFILDLYVNFSFHSVRYLVFNGLFHSQLKSVLFCDAISTVSPRIKTHVRVIERGLFWGYLEINL